MQRIPIDAVPGQGETILALHAAKVSSSSIGRHIGRNGWSIIRWLDRRGLWQSRRLTDDEIARMHALLKDGCTRQETADAIGRPLGTVNSHVERARLRVDNCRLTNEKRRRILALDDRRAPIKEIEKLTGTSRATILAVRKAAGRPLRKRIPTPEEEARVVGLYLEKTPINQISRETGIPPPTIRVILKRAGVHDPEGQGAAAWRNGVKPSENHVWRKRFTNRR